MITLPNANPHLQEADWADSKIIGRVTTYFECSQINECGAHVFKHQYLVVPRMGHGLGTFMCPFWLQLEMLETLKMFYGPTFIFEFEH